MHLAYNNQSSCYIYILVFSTLLFCQSTITDSLLELNNNQKKEIVLLTIQKWQDLSYSSDHLNCQFYPSCSNYFSQSIYNNNIFLGIIIGADRLIRCNPFAIKHYFQKKNIIFHEDGRLIDEYQHIHYLDLSIKNNKAFYLSVIPGLGRIYSGKIYDGISSSLTITSLLYGSFYFYHTSKLASLSFLVLGFIFWGADFYNAIINHQYYKDI